MEKGREYFIAGRFLCEGRVLDVRCLGQGLINETFLITTDRAELSHFVLQRINPHVFPHPDRILRNLECLRRHLAAKPEPIHESADRGRFRLPALLRTTEGTNVYIDEHGDSWRGLTFIEHSQTLGRIESPEDAAQVGFALGRFHNLLADLDPSLMQDSLPGFHVGPGYLRRYEQVAGAGLVADRRSDDSAEIRFCTEFIEARKKRFFVLDDARRKGVLRMRVVHGDPKLNNFLFDKRSRKAVAMIDLDTVKPGLIHYDLGDCLRSCCNRVGESVEPSEPVGFDRDICESILEGYCRESASFLTRRDVDYLYDAISLLPLELGLRFFTDYLSGNRYFKVGFPAQNLRRASVQFRLASSVEKMEPGIRSLIQKIFSSAVRS